MAQKLRQHREIIMALLGGVLLVIAFLSEAWGSPALTAVFYLLTFTVGGYYKAKEGVLDLVYDKSLNVEILMIIAALGAASIGHWHEGAILIFIFSVSGAMETYANQKSERNLSSLVEMAPGEANRLNDDDSVTVVALDELNIGDRVLVKDGERVPVDGVILSGQTSVDESPITGESMPADKAAGDDVYNGTMNGTGSVVVEMTKPNKDSLFQKMIRLVEEAKENRPPTQQLIEKIEGPYVVTVLVVVGLMLLSPFVFGFNFEDVFYRAMVLLVVASPCAVVASIMPSLLSAVSTGARKGVLTKGGVYLEQLSKMAVVALDKTGTITKGEPVVTDIMTADEFDDRDVLRHIVAIENQSSHPLAEAIVRYGDTHEVHADLEIAYTESITGYGIQAGVNDETWYVGNEALIDRLGLVKDDFIKTKKALQQEGKTIMFIANGKEVAGMIAVKDEIRPEAKQLIETLNERGVKTVMITGDNDQTAQAISEEAGIDEWISECLPEQKVHEVERLRETYGSIAMVGDGINDAPAMAKADVGIAMGSGTDVAIETSDIVLMNNLLKNISMTFNLSTRLNRIVKQNLVFSVAVILLLIVTNFSQGLTLPYGVVAHEGSTILVILNGLRLLKE
ncbi:heavy metal translocating P-type ATPase [Alkalibacillus salilacus]|uniref:Cd2+/Zn2+-exporting ATPase n=1 Tax=Alkalibacillus salilacus TaxID=284582 RepID=A0ABT9VH99_9BACI|nr:heavy metal translocating P-type ATPase [Alkalibacillus salilacus]MDQ0160334.1 Cd2+/Zn2+-exporting ATPase [Alkalibacillus salilacus]